jgi:hypothetical protein
LGGRVSPEKSSISASVHRFSDWMNSLVWPTLKPFTANVELTVTPYLSVIDHS